MQSIGTNCVSCSELAIPNPSSSRLICRPLGEVGILIPISWRTEVRLRGETSQNLNPGLPTFKAHAINRGMLKNYFLIIEGNNSLKIQTSQIDKVKCNRPSLSSYVMILLRKANNRYVSM